MLDIETTGLTPARSKFVLGGLLTFAEDCTTLKQFFAESAAEESRLLSLYLAEALQYDALITYNGARFDIPFLRERAERLGLPAPDFPYNLDLYLVLNRFSALRKVLPNLKQKTVEEFMGLWPLRKDDISGAESARLYQEYLRLSKNSIRLESNANLESSTQLEIGVNLEESAWLENSARLENIAAKAALEAMLLHNRDDVLQLARLLPVLEKTDFHSAMYAFGFPVLTAGAAHDAPANPAAGAGCDAFETPITGARCASPEKPPVGEEPFPAANQGWRVALAVEKIAIDAEFLTVSGRQFKGKNNAAVDFISYGAFDDDLFVQFEKSGERFVLRFRLLRKSGLALLDLTKRGAPVREKMRPYPNCNNDFLILEKQKRISYTEINAFVSFFLESLVTSRPFQSAALPHTPLPPV